MATSTAGSIEYVDVEGRPGGHALASGALGIGGLLFCIATAAAPITAMLFNVPVAVMGSAYGAPGAFILATIALTIFAVGYIEMARRVTTAGGFYSFVSHAFGQVAGAGTAALITISYLIFTGALVGTFAYFASTTVDDLFSVNVPAWAYEILAFVLLLSFAYLHIELTARTLGVFLVSEVIALLIFGVAILIHGGASGVHPGPLNPANLFHNKEATRVFGSAAAGVALFGAFWSWVGFEMVPNYVEESRTPHKLVGRVTYATVIGLGVLYTFICWMFVTGWGSKNVAQAVSDQFAGKYSSAFYPLATRYAGDWLRVAMEVLIVTGSFACVLAFFNTSSRYIFALGRERIIPSVFGRVRANHSPFNAAVLVTIVVGLYVLAFTLYDSSTTGILLKLATWSPLLAVTGLLSVQALVSAAIIWYFWRHARDGFHVIRTFLAPLLGVASMAFAVYLVLANRETLAGAKNVPFLDLIPWMTLAFFVLGIAVALVYRARDPERYAGIGRFVREDVEAPPAAEPVEELRAALAP